jgi:Tfp pilus assembly protein PilX
MDQNYQKGSALLLTTILLFVVLSMVVSFTYLTVLDQKMSQNTKSSVRSFYNAESGVEWALNKLVITDKSSCLKTIGTFNAADNSVDCPFGGCKVHFLDENGNIIDLNSTTASVGSASAVRVVGTEDADTARAIEVNANMGPLDCNYAYRHGNDPVVMMCGGNPESVEAVGTGSSSEVKWGLRCTGGYSKTSCYLANKAGNSYDLWDSIDGCLTDNEEFLGDSTISIICCKM